MHDPVSPALASAALRNAFPYLRLFQGRTFVIKAGGDAFEDGGRALLEQVSILHRLGIRVVLVHGGGPQIDRLSRRVGIDSVMVNGRRVTCDETLEATMMALNGSVNTGIVARLREFETRAVGISGVDANTVTATRREPQTIDGQRVDFGNVGDIVTIDTTLIEGLLRDGTLPVLSPLSADEHGNPLNVNADSIASRMAIALGAEKVIFLTKTPGILLDADDPESLLSYTDLEGLAKLEENGTLSAGMLPKTAAIADALKNGVSRVHVISHRTPDTLLIEIFTNEGSGTLVVADTRRMTPQELNDAAPETTK